MNKIYPPYRIGLLLCAAIVLILCHVDGAWSAPLDLAHHYALVFRLWENWQLVPGDPSLLEMNVYPRASHIVAAVLGMVFNSPFLGMQVSALASLAMVWGAYLWLLSMLPARAATASIAMLGLLVLVNHQFIGMNIHGSEIVNSFFYAQLVAQGLALLSIGAAVALEVGGKRMAARAVLMLAIFLLPAVHLLPAVELLALFGGLMVVDIIMHAGSARQRLRHAASNALLFALSVASVVLHPAFKVMRGISDNNGELLLTGLPTYGALALLCLVCIAVSLLLLRTWRRDPAQHPVYRYLALYGCGIALLCLLQIVLWRAGMGSEYAARKYAFGLSSFLLVSAAYYAGAAFGAWSGSSVRLRGYAAHPAVASVVLVAAMSLAFSYAARWNKVLDTSDVVAVERQLLMLRETAVTPPPAGKQNIVTDVHGLSNELNYMFAIAIMHTPRDTASGILVGRLPRPLSQFDTIITSRKSSRYDRPGCARNPSGPLVLAEGECVEKRFSEASVCKEAIDFSNNGLLDPGMLAGFSGAEAWSRWTEARQARFTCLSVGAPRVATLYFTPFLARPDQRQRVSFSVNGGKPVIREFHHPSAAEALELPLPEVASGTPLVFALDLPDAISPDALGVNPDRRQLGIAVTKVTFK